MASVSDGTYRISINGQQFLTVLSERMVVLIPDDAGRQLWQVRRTDNGGYTIRQDTTDLYLGYEGEPDTFEPVRLLPDRREWISPTGQTRAPSLSPLPEVANR
jgi:hypothetical protein